MISLALAAKIGAAALLAGGSLATGDAVLSSNSTPIQAPKTVIVRVYIVRPGDNLAQISAWFCGSPNHYPSLAAANRIANPRHIEPGWRIILDCTAKAKILSPASTAVPTPPTPTPTATRKKAKPVPTQTPQQAIVPASTPRPTITPSPAHSAGPKPTASEQSPRPLPSNTASACVIAAGGSPIVPGTYIQQYSRCGLVQLWIAAGGSKAEANRAACMALAVSNGITFKTGSHGNEGIWQIPLSPAGYATYQPAANARAAVILSKNGTSWSWITGANC
jgi:hypothetical protein